MGISLRTSKIKEDKLPLRELPTSIKAADTAVGVANTAGDFARKFINKKALPFQFGQQVLGQGAGMVADAFSGREPQDFVPPASLIQSSNLELPSSKYQAAQAKQLPIRPEQTPEGQEVIPSPTRPQSEQELPTGADTIGKDRELARSTYTEDGEFNDSNINSYLKQSGYISDNDPRMQKRRAEAEAIQARRMQFIEDSEQGKFSSGANPTFGAANTIARPGKGVGIGGGSAFERAFDKKYTSEQQVPQSQFSSNKAPTRPRPIARGRNVNNIKRAEEVKGPSLSDQIAAQKQGKEFSQDFSLRGFPGLSPEVGQEVYDQASATGIPFTDIQSLLTEELTKLKSDNPDADFSKNSPEIISLLKNRIRHEQSR